MNKTEFVAVMNRMEQTFNKYLEAIDALDKCGFALESMTPFDSMMNVAIDGIGMHYPDGQTAIDYFVFELEFGKSKAVIGEYRDNDGNVIDLGDIDKLYAFLTRTV